MNVITIGLAGAESTGKSWLADRLASHLGCEAVPEYGRLYCEQHGTDISMEELVHIGRQQVADIAAAQDRARANGIGWVIADTDALVTAVWADMMFDARDAWFATAPVQCDFTLVPQLDLDWENDGLRIYGRDMDRARLLGRVVAEIESRGGNWSFVGGKGEQRFINAVTILNAALGVPLVTD